MAEEGTNTSLTTSAQQAVIAINNLVAATSALATVTNTVHNGLYAPVGVVADLPVAASSQGLVRLVTDATATTRLSVVAGGGADIVLVYSDGTDWLIV